MHTAGSFATHTGALIERTTRNETHESIHRIQGRPLLTNAVTVGIYRFWEVDHIEAIDGGYSELARVYHYGNDDDVLWARLGEMDDDLFSPRIVRVRELSGFWKKLGSLDIEWEQVERLKFFLEVYAGVILHTSSRYESWKVRKARKEHLDEFGDHIVPREHYFHSGNGYSAGTKVSIPSARAMYRLMVSGRRDEEFEELYQDIMAEQKQQLVEAHAKLAPSSQMNGKSDDSEQGAGAS